MLAVALGLAPVRGRCACLAGAAGVRFGASGGTFRSALRFTPASWLHSGIFTVLLRAGAARPVTASAIALALASALILPSVVCRFGPFVPPAVYFFLGPGAFGVGRVLLPFLRLLTTSCHPSLRVVFALGSVRAGCVVRQRVAALLRFWTGSGE